jgi:hypothetical protein
VIGSRKYSTLRPQVGSWLSAALQSLAPARPEHGSDRTFGLVSTAVGHRADLPWAGLERPVATPLQTFANGRYSGAEFSRVRAFVAAWTSKQLSIFIRTRLRPPCETAALTPAATPNGPCELRELQSEKATASVKCLTLRAAMGADAVFAKRIDSRSTQNDEG